jgi:hypothetical protein
LIGKKISIPHSSTASYLGHNTRKRKIILLLPSYAV